MDTTKTKVDTKSDELAPPGQPMFANQDPGSQILTKVTLKQDHTHAGEKYKAGESIEVNDADAKWLRDNNVI